METLSEQQQPTDFPLRLFPILSQTLYLRCLMLSSTDNVPVNLLEERSDESQVQPDVRQIK